MTLAAGPVSVVVPVTVSAPLPQQQQPATAPDKPRQQIASNLVSVVKNVLPDWQGTEPVNILLLGIDKRDNEQIEGTRSDTMILASIDPVAKSATLVSLPRDMWVNIPGCGPRAGCIGGTQRINVAHAVGGPDLAVQTISRRLRHADPVLRARRLQRLSGDGGCRRWRGRSTSTGPSRTTSTRRPTMATSASTSGPARR